MTGPAMTGLAMTGPAMTGPAMTGRAARGGTLGLRLALAFLAVALAAIVLLAGLTAVFAAADISTLGSQQRADLASTIAGRRRGGLGSRPHLVIRGLSTVLDQAARTGEAVQVRDQAGGVVATFARLRLRPRAAGQFGDRGAG